jgi:hypothetical protein
VNFLVNGGKAHKSILVMIDLKRTNADDEDFLALVEMLDAELRVRDGEEQDFYSQFNMPVGLSGVVVAYLENLPVGCGAFKKYSDETAEIKRMFVNPDARGNRTDSTTCITWRLMPPKA